MDYLSIWLPAFVSNPQMYANDQAKKWSFSLRLIRPNHHPHRWNTVKNNTKTAAGRCTKRWRIFWVGKRNSKARKEHWTKERCRNISLAPPKPSLHHGSKSPYRDHHIHLSALQEPVGSIDKLLIAPPNAWGVFGKWKYCVVDCFSTSIKKLPKKKRDATGSSAKALWIRKKKKSFNLCVACATILDVTGYKISNWHICKWSHGNQQKTVFSIPSHALVDHWVSQSQDLCHCTAREGDHLLKWFKCKHLLNFILYKNHAFKKNHFSFCWGHEGPNVVQDHLSIVPVEHRWSDPTIKHTGPLSSKTLNSVVTFLGILIESPQKNKNMHYE